MDDTPILFDSEENIALNNKENTINNENELSKNQNTTIPKLINKDNQINNQSCTNSQKLDEMLNNILNSNNDNLNKPIDSVSQSNISNNKEIKTSKIIINNRVIQETIMTEKTEGTDINEEETQELFYEDEINNDQIEVDNETQNLCKDKDSQDKDNIKDDTTNDNLEVDKMNTDTLQKNTQYTLEDNTDKDKPQDDRQDENTLEKNIEETIENVISDNIMNTSNNYTIDTDGLISNIVDTDEFPEDMEAEADISMNINNDNITKINPIKSIRNISIKKCNLPLSKVKLIMKTDPDIKVVNSEAILVAALAAEQFLKFIIQETSRITLRNKKKTLMKHHLDEAIKGLDITEFLEGMLD